MKELVVALLTFGLGLLAFAAQQFFQSLVVDPLADYRRVRGRLATFLLDKANVFANPGVDLLRDEDKSERVSRELRQLVSELYGAYETLAFHDLLVRLRAIPSAGDFGSAVSSLIGVSNSLVPGCSGTENSKASAEAQAKLLMMQPLKRRR